MNSKYTRDALDRLTDALVEEILETSDDDLIAEIEAEGDDPKTIADYMRSLYERAFSNTAKTKLIAAKAAVEQQRKTTAPVVCMSNIDARKKFNSIVERRPNLMKKLTLAARNGEELSDRDIQGFLEDLNELGALGDNT